jgi:hypothetical protein
VNPEHIGVRCPPGSTIENNLIVNCDGVSPSRSTPTPATSGRRRRRSRSNTLLFTATFKEPGKGAYNGSAIQVNGPVNITNNLIAFQDNNAIYETFLTEKVSITKNVFHMNLYSNLRCSVDGKAVVIDNKNMGDLEEVGLKAFDGNDILDPQITIDKDWLDLYSKRTAYQPGKLDDGRLEQDAAAPRPAADRAGRNARPNVAPAYPLDEAFALLEPKNAKCAAGPEDQAGVEGERRGRCGSREELPQGQIDRLGQEARHRERPADGDDRRHQRHLQRQLRPGKVRQDEAPWAPAVRPGGLGDLGSRLPDEGHRGGARLLRGVDEVERLGQARHALRRARHRVRGPGLPQGYRSSSSPWRSSRRARR